MYGILPRKKKASSPPPTPEDSSPTKIARPTNKI